MNDTGAKGGRRKVWRYLLWSMLAGILLFAGLGWYSTTDSFRSLVRQRLISTLERITGGRVELGSIHTVPFHLQLEVRDVTIHGGEQPGEVPYAHLNSLVAQVKIWSILQSEIGLNYVILDHPVIHIILYPDGTTNQPEPRLKVASEKKPIEQLFALSINRLEVRHGEVLWGDQKIPLDFAVNDVAADMSYSFFRSRYDGNMLLGKADTLFKNYRPLAWTAEAHFSLGQNLIQVRSLNASSGRSRLQARGQVVDFSRPKIEGEYDLTVDVAEAAAIARRPEVRRGMLQLTGHGSWSAQDFSSIGKALISNLDWRDAPLGVHHADVSTQYALNPKRLILSQIQGRVFGGTLAGDADVTEWMHPQSAGSAAKGKDSERQAGVIHLRFKDLSAAELAAALSTPARPFHRLRSAGQTSGTTEVRWKGSPRSAEAQFVADVMPPAHPSNVQLPLTAHAQGIYRAGPSELQLDEFNAATRATQVRASGTLSNTAAIKLSVATTDLGEWQPVLSAAGYSGPIPVTLRGHASFNGTATGKISEINIAGNLQSQDFETLIPATSQAAEKMVHWNALRGDIELSPYVFAVRNGTLSRDPDVLKFDFHTSLSNRQFTDSSPFQAHFDTRNADLTRILSLAGYTYPVTGTLDFQLQLAGTRADPHGQAHILLHDGTLYDEPVERFCSDLVINGQEIELVHIRF